MPPADYNVPLSDDRASVVCLYCNRAQDVARRAITITCRYCHKSLRLEDMRIKEYLARNSVDTCGFITVEKKGTIVASKSINCGGLIVRGKIKGTVNCRGPVRVGPEAEIKGDLTAPVLEVGPGAVLEGHYEIGPKPLPGADAATTSAPAPTPPDTGR